MIEDSSKADGFVEPPQAWRFNPGGFYADNYAQSTARLGIGIDYQDEDYDRYLAQFLRDLEAHDAEVRARVMENSSGDPVALNPVLRGVDLAMERLLLFEVLTPEVESCLNALRYELATQRRGSVSDPQRRNEE